MYIISLCLAWVRSDSFRITNTFSSSFLPRFTTHRSLIDFVAINYFTKIQCVVIFFRIKRRITICV